MSYQKRTLGVRKAPPKASRAAAEILSRLARTTRYADPDLTERWSAIVGTETAMLARPGRITGARNARTLEIIVADGPAAAEAQMRSDDILKALNRYLGPRAVARIAIRRQTPPAAPDAPDAPSGGQQSSLENALASFRAAVSADKS